MPRSKNVNSKTKREWIFAAGVLTFALTVLTAGAWFALSFTETNATAERSDEAKKPSSDLFFTNRTQQMIAAYSEKKKLLAMEKDLQRKYDKSKKSFSVRSDPDRESIYRDWRKRKEQTEKFYSRFKDEGTTDPNSIKLQMQKTLKSYESDRPVR